ncbi:hypothetical protein Lal_00009939 [Lupinus albus]|uniref:Uncharacterized protein n=1 Tax=Lupinus albus TaxID=3870 RepID=A0A6A4NH96_LUPAL|nr:hypothetical protein Lalb_Chr24g0397871 [Lupinus albus]KAF1859355.1 hypothetical protein Lal_00009939 [Lupinus albus]
MAMRSERSKSLHNFNLPCLKWGSQKFLKCVNVTFENHQSQPSSSSSLDLRSLRIKSKSHQTHINKIQHFPTKNLKVSNFEDGGDESGTVNSRPWNLRTRRAACKAPQSKTPHEEKCNFFDVGIASSSVKEDKKKKKVNESERAEFKVSLSKEEVEHDFMALVGTKPPRRPKKRPRIVQRQLDTLFPGLWLTKVTAESYKVLDVPE